MCVRLLASFVAARLPPLDSRVSKSPNILIEIESSWFVMLHPAIQQQLKTILPVMSSSHVSCTSYIAPAVFQQVLAIPYGLDHAEKAVPYLG